MASGNTVAYADQSGPVLPPKQHPSDWCCASGKRVFDTACASVMFACLLPAMLVIAVFVKLSSPGPVFFRQLRCGKGGTLFEVLKFRTMTQSGSGPALTRAGDARVTRIGAVLRHWKLDELPQLVNVIRGEMSLVGPRPDLPEYFAAASLDVRRVLAVRPGVTGWASIHFRNEEALLAQAPVEQLHDFYVHRVLPRKAILDLEYAARATFLSDVGLLLQTIFAVLPARKQAKGEGCGSCQQ